MIVGTPLAIAQILSFDDGEGSKQDTIFQIPEGKWFVMEAVGVNAFLQPNQDLVVFVAPFLDNGAYTFPIVLNGESDSADPAYKIRRFGSQSLTLYADGRLDIIASRSVTTGIAHVEFNISGRLV